MRACRRDKDAVVREKLRVKVFMVEGNILLSIIFERNFFLGGGVTSQVSSFQFACTCGIFCNKSSYLARTVNDFL